MAGAITGAGVGTQRCGVLGDPIAHSLSPVLHRAGYAAVGLDWSYDAHRVPAGSLRDFLTDLGEEWVGLSLTMPLKREALGLVDRVTDRARQAGGVNTLLLGDELVGDNTDLPGAVAAVRERTDVDLRTAVVLGGGEYYGHGIGIGPAEMFIRHLNRQRRPGATRSAFLSDLVTRPGFAYLSQFEGSSFAQASHAEPLPAWELVIARIGSSVWEV